MPHIVIEYAKEPLIESRVERLLDAIVDMVSASGVFPPTNLKLRAMPCAHVRVAGVRCPFVHASVAMMAGVALEARRDLSERLLQTLVRALPEIADITVDIREMNPETYGKRLDDMN